LTNIQYKGLGNGIVETKLTHWSEYYSVVQTLLDLPHYIFRGHRRDDWKLEPTLTRIIKNKPHAEALRERHLEEFKYSVRGRRGTNPAKLDEPNDWWALGQHNGLATPLLDWSTSPYVGLFFAFSETDPKTDTANRVVYALNSVRVKETCAQLPTIHPNAELVTFVRPLSDENARLVNQAGLFTRSPDNMNIEEWVSNYCVVSPTQVILLKIYIPNQDRIECLKALNRMNINHSTLFPDLDGAARFTNMRLEIENY
jgi:hypothetical protein